MDSARLPQQIAAARIAGPVVLSRVCQPLSGCFINKARSRGGRETPITSYIVEEGPGRGKGHVSHGNGKGKGHEKHAHEAMADGEYTIVVDGIDHQNHSAANQTSAPHDAGRGLDHEYRGAHGAMTIDDAPGAHWEALHLDTGSGNGRLRLNNLYDAHNRFTLGELDQLSSIITSTAPTAPTLSRSFA